MEWQPIETAPANDDYILVIGHSWGRKSEGFFYLVVVSKTDGLYNEDLGDFIDFATHWMPLPQPPKE